MKIKVELNLVKKCLHYLTIYSLLHLEDKSSDFERLLEELEKTVEEVNFNGKG